MVFLEQEDTLELLLLQRLLAKEAGLTWSEGEEERIIPLVLTRLGVVALLVESVLVESVEMLSVQATPEVVEAVEVSTAAAVVLGVHTDLVVVAEAQATGTM